MSTLQEFSPTTEPVVPKPFNQGPSVSDRYVSLVRQLRGRRQAADTGLAVGLTGCMPGEGVSTIAANLAVSAAQGGDGEVLLIDANNHRPAMKRAFRLDHGPGWTDLLAGRVDAASCVQATDMDGLFVIPDGSNDPRTASNCDPAAIKTLLERVKREFGWIVVDLPVANEQTPCFTYARALDGILLVIEAEGVRRPVALRVKEQLLRAGADILGVVLNKRKKHVPDWLYRRL